MVIVYDSLTGQGKRFASHLEYKCMSVSEYIESKEEVFLLTRSINFGEVPKTTEIFLKNFAHKVVGVAVSGNRTWGHNYGKAGEIIENEYHIPLVLKYEGSGYPEDRQVIKDWIKEYINKRET